VGIYIFQGANGLDEGTNVVHIIRSFFLEMTKVLNAITLKGGGGCGM
jgi:hypothetical protein